MALRYAILCEAMKPDARVFFSSFVLYLLSFSMSLGVAILTKGGLLILTLPSFLLLFLSVSLSRREARSTQKDLPVKTPPAFMLLLFFATLVFCVWFVLPSPQPAAFYSLIFLCGMYAALKLQKMPGTLPFALWVLLLISFYGTGSIFFYAILSLLFTLCLFPLGFFNIETFYRKPPFVCALAFFNVFFAALVFHSLSGSRHSTAKKILSQPRIRPVVVYAQSRDPLTQKLKESTLRFALEGCEKNTLLAGARGKHGLYKLDIKKRAVLDATNASRAGDTVFLDCTEHMLYFTDNASNRILVYDIHNLRRARFTYTLAGGWQSMWASLSRDRRFLLAVDDTSTVYVFARGKNLPLHSFHVPGMSLSYPVWLDDARVLISSKKGILSYAFKENKTRVLVPWRAHHEMNLQLAYDKTKKRIFAASDISGLLYAFNLHDEAAQKKIRLGPFIRYMAYDEKHRMIYLADHVFGVLYAVHAETLRVRRTFFIGSRTHALHLSPDGNRLYFASSAGIFYLDTRHLNK